MAYGNYPDLSLVKKICIIKLRHHGDVLLSSVVFANLKRVLPDAKITAFLYRDTHPMLDGHPAIDAFHLHDRKVSRMSLFKRLWHELRTLWKIRKEKYDLVINLTEGDRGAFIAWASKARYRVGFDPEKSGFYGKEKIYTHLVKNCPLPRHVVERHCDVLRCLGIFPTIPERELHFHIPENACDIPSQDYVVLHPTSRWLFKCVPTELIAKTIDFVASQGLHVALTSGPDQKELTMIEQILSLVTTDKVISYAGKTSLKGLGALIQASRALICVDSVPLHMASAFKTPVLVFFGPTSETEWGPWQHPKAEIVRQQFSCRPCQRDGCGGSKVSDCLTSLSLDSVIEAFNRLKLEVITKV